MQRNGISVTIRDCGLMIYENARLQSNGVSVKMHNYGLTVYAKCEIAE